ncbi:MAG: (d)CMP kinase [Tannerella sp.]|jgi:cytidylate kinase|nr:(d)CMP kinase [Tannerella sp.]
MEEKKRIIVAIDGVSSSGKSTMAKQLAKTVVYKYIDTGAMYRAVTLYALRNQLFEYLENLENEMNNIKINFLVNPETGGSETYLNGENVENEIRGMDVSNRVSEISALPFVRAYLVAIQQNIGKEKGIVMDGRDIGTVVFPDAELKIFVTATAEIRAERRYKELQAKGEKVSYEEILDNIKNRDYQDTNRAISPLRKAGDAITFDSTNSTVEEQDERLLNIFNKIVYG